MKVKKTQAGVYVAVVDGVERFTICKNTVKGTGWVLTEENVKIGEFSTKKSAQEHAKDLVDGIVREIEKPFNPYCPTLHCRICGNGSKSTNYCTVCNNRGDV